MAFADSMHSHRHAMQVIMPVCSRLAGRHIDTTFGIMDVAGGRRKGADDKLRR